MKNWASTNDARTHNRALYSIAHCRRDVDAEVNRLARGVAQYRFDPDWVIPPGWTLKEWFEAMNLPKSIAWELYGIPERTLNRLFEGAQKITPALAQKLCNMTHVGAPFWLALEHNYRVGLREGKTLVK